MLNRKKNENTFKLVNKGSIKSVRATHIAQDLSWNYGVDVVIYDVRDLTPFISYYIVASAENDYRLKALMATAKDSLYENYKTIKTIEGKHDSKWILMDAGDIVIQLFTKEERRRVGFDELYKDAPHKIIVAKEEPVYKRRKKPVKTY